MSSRIDLAWMIRAKLAVPGQRISGTIRWTCGGSPAGSISYSAEMEDADNSSLRLSYFRGSGADREEVVQHVPLVFTEPNFGGRRWWMVCPYSGLRVGKLYLPSGGDRFAGRRSWRIGYKSQRVTARDQPFEQMFRLQRKLGCEEGFDSYIFRPKGMWQRTFERHLKRFEELNDQCGAEMMLMVLRMGGKR